MATDYRRITSDNIRRYGEDTAVLDLLRDLYAERTHFLLELLQNAEDAGASWVRFALGPDQLELRHNGRPFTEQDVIGICGVARGTKHDDLTQIGTFGIGFKSVYAYTDSPEVYSGDEHFRIIHYVRPCATHPRADVAPDETLFIFPFDRAEIHPDRARVEIKLGLKRLSARTLLFLQHIDRIEWETGDDAGSYLRQSAPFGKGSRIKVISERFGKHVDQEDWLVLQRPVTAPDSGPLRVEVAFRLRDRTNGGLSIQPISDSQLVVFFPTETATRLGFVIQGPYQTTPARDNIPKDTEWNRLLVRETSELLTTAVPWLRDMNLLSVSLLKALPIVEDDFPSEGMFRPLFDAVKEAFVHEPLIPAFGGGFVRAGQAKLARGADLRALIGNDELVALFSDAHGVRWVAEEVTPDRGIDVHRYLRDTLGIDEVTPESFLKKVTDDFLESRSDEWLTNFYRFLRHQESLWKERWTGRVQGPLVDLSLLRLEDGTHRTPFRTGEIPAAFLPPDGDTAFPIVKRVIAADYVARDFLQRLGLSEPDIVDEVLNFIVPKYPDADPLTIRDNEIEHDMAQVLKALKTDSQEKRRRLTDRLRRAKWVRSINAATGEVAFQSPREVYFATDELLLYLEHNQHAWFLDEFYDRWASSLRDLGVSSDVRVDLRRPGGQGHVQLVSEWGHHERGLHGFDPHCQIDGLAHALTEITLEKSLFIWNRLLGNYSNQIRGTVEESTRQEFDNPRKTPRWSAMGELARNHAWLPSRKGGLHRPSELGLDELPSDFERNKALATAFEMRLPADVETLAEGTGLKTDVLRFLMQHPEQAEEFVRRFQAEQMRRSEQQQPVSTALLRTSSGDSQPGSARSDGQPINGEHGRERTEMPPGEAAAGVGFPVDRPSRAGQSATEARPGPHEVQGTGDRLPVYVAHERGDVEDDPESRARRAAVETAGIRRVVEFERDQGRRPIAMSANNPGYDVESMELDGSMRFIEVKSLFGTWGTPGVALTRTEFQTATARGDTYWLYVVESALTDDSRVHCIQDPARRVNQFVYDEGWEALGADL